MIISIVNPFDPLERYDSLLTINTRTRGVTKLNLKYAINQPNQLQAIFNVNLPAYAYDAIKDNDYGVRIKSNNHDLIFIQDKTSKRIDSQGQISVNFYSGIYGALYSEPSIINRQYINSSAIVTANLISGFEFINISADQTINLATGSNSNLDILNELRKSTASWSYFDTGLYPRGDGSFTKRILLGQYSNIENYAGIDPRFATEKLEVSRLRNMFNTNPVLLDSEVFYNGKQIQFLYPILDTGQGTGATNSSQIFTRTDYSFVDPEYPLVNINGKVYIQDTNYTGLQSRYQIYPVTLTAATDNGAGSQIYNLNDALSYLYRKSVYYLKTQKETTRIACQIAFRKLTYPKYLQVDFDKTIKNMRGEKIVAQSVHEKMLYTELEFDLTNL